MSCSAARHEAAIQMFWLHFQEALMSSFYSQWSTAVCGGQLTVLQLVNAQRLRHSCPEVTCG